MSSNHVILNNVVVFTKHSNSLGLFEEKMTEQVISHSNLLEWKSKHALIKQLTSLQIFALE